MNDEVNTMSTVKDPYIILKGNPIDYNKADEEMIETKVDNAVDFNTI